MPLEESDLPKQYIPSFLPECGNDIIDSNEQCECVLYDKQTCSHCCVNCRLVQPGAECGSGICCNPATCKPFHASDKHVCRPSRDKECDLEEYCNGTSAECPQDIYIHDGLRCSGTGRCYHGKCGSHQLACSNHLNTTLNFTTSTWACYEYNLRNLSLL